MSTTTGPAPASRRLLAALVALTALVAAVDLGGALDLDPVRRAAATVLGPVERALGPGDDEAGALRAQNLELAAQLSAAQRASTASPALAELLAAPALAGTVLVPARVVAVGADGPAGPERVTIDVGSRDGVEPERTVLAADGLVGRVVSVAPWTSEVLLVGAPELALGVRVGEAGVLGQASGSAIAGGARPDPGRLSLTLVERGTMRPGDAVTSLGSAGGVPYVPGVRVGTVTSVDDAVGAVAASGSVAPAVDPTSLDVVAVVLEPARVAPRPAVTAGAP